MAIQLKKGQGVSLRKDDHDLSAIGKPFELDSFGHMLRGYYV
ncbi:MAG: hypothetical protein ACT4QB_11815 [Gammaproteobacteria bacterium]